MTTAKKNNRAPAPDAALRERMARIRLVIFDVDGVLTDGSILLLPDGAEVKRFNVLDGAGIKYLERAGIATALLTGRRSRVVNRRAKELGIRFVIQNSKRKLDGLDKILRAAGVTPEQTAYMGDDLPDIPVMRAVALPAAPADARPQVLRIARWIARANGGRGAAREFAEAILVAQDRWATIMQRYETDAADRTGASS